MCLDTAEGRLSFQLRNCLTPVKALEASQILFILKLEEIFHFSYFICVILCFYVWIIMAFSILHKIVLEHCILSSEVCFLTTMTTLSGTFSTFTGTTVM